MGRVKNKYLVIYILIYLHETKNKKKQQTKG